jgi:hypothetical protein
MVSLKASDDFGHPVPKVATRFNKDAVMHYLRRHAININQLAGVAHFRKLRAVETRDGQLNPFGFSL